MSKTEIMAELNQLSSDDLAEVRAWLDRRLRHPAGTVESSQPAQIRTPRLANAHQAADFVKQVRELPGDAAI